MARMALGLGVPVIPVSQWGAHEVLQYGNDWGKLRTAARAVVRRPALKVHVGPPVRLDDLQMGRVGDANRARYRIAAAITRGLVPLRAGEEGGRTTSTAPVRPRRWRPTRVAWSRTTSRETRSGNRCPPVLDPPPGG